MHVARIAVLTVAAAFVLQAPASAAVITKPVDQGLAYAGETDQTLAVSLVLTKDRKKVKRLDISWLALPMQCSSGLPYFSMTTFGGGSTRALAIGATKGFRHTFNDGVSLPGDVSLEEVPTIRGTVGLKRAFGTFRSTVVLKDATGAEVNRCDTGAISWTAVQ